MHIKPPAKPNNFCQTAVESLQRSVGRPDPEDRKKYWIKNDLLTESVEFKYCAVIGEMY